MFSFSSLPCRGLDRSQACINFCFGYSVFLETHLQAIDQYTQPPYVAGTQSFNIPTVVLLIAPSHDLNKILWFQLWYTWKDVLSLLHSYLLLEGMILFILCYLFMSGSHACYKIHEYVRGVLLGSVLSSYSVGPRDLT